MTLRDFLAWYFQNCAGDIGIVAIDPTKPQGDPKKLHRSSFSHPYDFAAMERVALAYSKTRRNSYFECCTSIPGSVTQGHRITEATAYELPALFGELDTYKSSTGESPSPDEADTHLGAINADKRLSGYVDSGGVGFHFYGKLAQPIRITDENRADLKATNYAFGKWLSGNWRPERFDLTSILRVPGTKNYPDPNKIEKYHRVEGDVLVEEHPNLTTFSLADFADLRQQFPYEDRNAQPIEAEPAPEVPADWETHLDEREWLLGAWQGLTCEDSSKCNFIVACYLEQHTQYTDPEKLAILAAHYLDPVGLGNPKQFPLAEVQRKARHALEAAREKVASQPEQPKQPATTEAATLKGALSSVSYQQLFAKYHDYKDKWIVDGWVSDPSIHVTYGVPGSYKTWLAYELLASIATGKPFCGMYDVVRPGPVLMVLLEESAPSFFKRMRQIVRTKLGTDNVDIPIHVHTEREFRFGEKSTDRKVEEWVKQYRPVLVGIDPLYNAGDTSDYFMKMITPMTALLRRLRDEYEVSSHIIHHATKGDFNGRNSLWGSNLLNAMFETTWGCEATIDKSKTPANILLDITRTSKLNEPPPETTLFLTIDFHHPTTPVLFGQAPTRADTETNVMTLLESKPHTTAEIAQGLKVPYSTAERLLKTMREKGMIGRDPNAKGSAKDGKPWVSLMSSAATKP